MQSKEARPDSGAVGGPGLGRGLNYQIDVAIFYALDMISRIVTAAPQPLNNRFIQIEPRHVEGGAVSRLDIFVGTDNLSIEAKANPTDADVTQFVQTARRSLEQDSARHVQFFCGTTGCSRARSLEQLIRVAVESAGNSGRFDELLAHERIRHRSDLLEMLGPTAIHLLPRISITYFPDSVLTDQINFRLRLLVSPHSVDSVRQLLYESFGRGMQRRATIFLTEFLSGLQKRQIEVTTSNAIVTDELGEPMATALYILQRCPTPLPLEVMSHTCGVDASQLRSNLEPHINAGNIVERGSDWLLSPMLVRPLCHSRSAEVLGRGLSALLAFTRANKTNDLGREQLENSVALVRECSVVNPLACLPSFHDIQGLLKRRGDKQLVLRAAELTVKAAQACPLMFENARQAEAEALICGMSWVYQRTNRLAEAEALAIKSLDIGKHIQWHRNAPFCQKCRGRLRRIQAERTSTKAARNGLLRDSESLLTEAIKLFTANTVDFGPRHPEVGDCYSLLGRTLLAAGTPTRAEQVAKIAESLVIDTESKDYMDLQILLGDIAAHKLSFPAALRKYDLAIALAGDESAERSEIAARAWLQKGMCLNRLDSKLWKDAIDRAETTWQSLDEEYMVAYAQWTRIKLENRISEQIIQRLQRESPAVSVEVVRLLETKRKSADRRRVVAARADLPDAQLREFISQAARTIEIKHRDW